MKKKIALLMCAIMLIGSMLAFVPASAAGETVNEAGPLAITEICYAPANEKYEFVEVMNVSNADVELKDYFIYRFGFSNGGTYHCDGILQMYGHGTNKVAQLSKLTLANAEGTTKMAKNTITVLWIASSMSKDETVNDFKNYWSGRGVNMLNVNVVKVHAYDANGTDISPAKNKQGINGVNANGGQTWLPDKQSGFVIAMINKSYADADVFTEAADITHENTVERHQAADCTAFVLLDPSCVQDTSAHYYDFIDKAKYTAALNDAEYGEDIELDKRFYFDPEVMYNNIMVWERTDANKEDLTVYVSTKGLKAIPFPTFNNTFLPNPGYLYNGQMGQTGELRILDAANGASSLVINITKPVVENVATAEKNEDKEDDKKTEDTKAPETKAPETSAAVTEEGGCGSAITASALLVIAPALAAGCVVTSKKRRGSKEK